MKKMKTNQRVYEEGNYVVKEIKLTLCRREGDRIVCYPNGLIMIVKKLKELNRS